MEHCNRNSRTNCDSLRWDTARTNWLIKGNRIEFLWTIFGAFKWMFLTIPMDLIGQLNLQLSAFVLRRKQQTHWFGLATRKRYLFVQQIFRNHYIRKAQLNRCNSEAPSRCLLMLVWMHIENIFSFLLVDRDCFKLKRKIETVDPIIFMNWMRMHWIINR